MTDSKQKPEDEKGGMPQKPQGGDDGSADSPQADSQSGQQSAEAQMLGKMSRGWDAIIDRAEKGFYRWLDSNAEAVIRRYHLMIAGIICSLIICLAAFWIIAHAIGEGEGNFGMWLFGGTVAVACVTAISMIARHIGRQPQVSEIPGEQHGKQNR